MTIALDPHALVAHVLRAVARPRVRVVTVEDIAKIVGARRADVRAAVSALHDQGLVDALRMRPTLEGLAVAAALRTCPPKALRQEREAAPLVAVA